ncbi:MAG TPA: hypothetical protein VF145_09500 [Chitinophagaceae bacterium]
MSRENETNPAENPGGERYVDEKTKEKIRQHLSDPNSRITDEDIENVNTDIFKRDETELTPGEEEEGAAPAPPEDEELPGTEPKAPNPWDVLSE